jgi:hypothetical protein
MEGVGGRVSRERVDVRGVLVSHDDAFLIGRLN